MISFSQGILSAQRKAKALRAAELKQKARTSAVVYGTRTSADLEVAPTLPLLSVFSVVGCATFPIALLGCPVKSGRSSRAMG